MYRLFERREGNIHKIVFGLVTGIFQTNLELSGQLEAKSVTSDMRVRSIAWL